MNDTEHLGRMYQVLHSIRNESGSTIRERVIDAWREIGEISEINEIRRPIFESEANGRFYDDDIRVSLRDRLRENGVTRERPSSYHDIIPSFDSSLLDYQQKRARKMDIEAEKERKRMAKLKPILTREAFGTMGIEATFFPTTAIPKAYADHADKWARFYNGIYKAFTLNYNENDIYKKLNKKVRAWVKNMESCDRGGIEFPTPEEYSTPQELYSDYKALCKFMENFDYAPSGIVDMDTEGGCHINIGIDRLSETHRSLFSRNLMRFLNNYPTLCWMNLSPNDNGSAKIITNSHYTEHSTSKGDCVNFRGDYVELRFFVMPRTNEEFVFHLEVANNLMWYIYELTKARVVLSNKNTEDSIQKYTNRRAIPEAKNVLTLIGCSVQEAIDLGKFDLIRERISFGPEYLI